MKFKFVLTVLMFFSISFFSQAVDSEERKFPLRINVLNGQSFELTVNQKMSVANIRQEAAGHLNITPEVIKIIFAGKLMTDDKKLEDYNILSTTSVSLVNTDRLPAKPKKTYGDIKKKHDTRIEDNKSYARDVYVLNISGMEYIAERYNEKYFKESDRKISVTKSKDDLNLEIEKFLNNDDFRIIGLTFPQGGSELNIHPIALMLEKDSITQKINLYIADGMGYDPFAGKIIKNLPVIKNLQDHFVIIESAYGRQSGNGPCRTEALVFLKNALLLDNIKENVKVLTAEELKNYIDEDSSRNPGDVSLMNSLQRVDQTAGRLFFIYKAPLLKTVQRSSTIKACIVDWDQALQNTKRKETFKEFQDKHHKKMPYQQTWNFETSEQFENGPIKKFKERSYLYKKTKRHQEILDQAS